MNNNEINITELCDLNHTISKEYLLKYTFPWEVLGNIKDIIEKIGKTLKKEEYNLIGDNVWVHNSVKISKTAEINGPTIIGANTEIRPSAYIRGAVLVGEGCVIGNSTELKNVIIFDDVQVPHYNYVGDSILGYKSHMGAGSITSNVKSDKSLVSVNINGEKIETGLKKFGAVLGDNVEIGCNSVLNPGTIIGRQSNIYPLTSVRGYIKPNSIVKNSNDIVEKI